jgi:hypothetical protein
VGEGSRCVVSDYYAEQLARAEAWERYIVARLTREGIPIVRHETKRAQISYGDVRIGPDHVELKLDQHFVETGNLFIEVEEKRRAEQAAWIASGIFASSEARWYGVGDYRDFFLFNRDALRQVARPERIITIKRGTSRGFLMKSSERLDLAVRVRHWSDVRADGSPVVVAPMLSADEIRWSL